MADLTVRETSIPGLFEITLPTHGDSRGWFQENYQKAKLEALGLPAFHVVQNNISYNDEIGSTRGIHAEPWEKYISLASGKAFAAIVDLRQGPTFGRVETFNLTPENAIFVPRGCGNSYQTLTPNVAYTYLVNEHWSADAEYTFCNLFDPALDIKWPIPKERAIYSEKDAHHPLFKDVVPMRVLHV